MKRVPDSRAVRVRRHLIAWSVLGSALSVPCAPGAQELPPALSVHVAASRTRAGLYHGDATVGAVAVGGWSLAARFRTARHIGGEAFFSFSSADDDPYDRAPGLRMVGGAVTASASRDPRRGFDLYGGVGFSYVRVTGWPDFSGCRPEDGCFREGGPDFSNGGGSAPVLVGGLSYGFSRLLVGVDVRWFGASDPMGQSATLLGFGVGLILP